MARHACVEAMEAGLEFPSILLFVYGRCQRSVCVRPGHVAHGEHHDSRKELSRTKNHRNLLPSRLLTLTHARANDAFRRMHAVLQPYECVWCADR